MATVEVPVDEAMKAAADRLFESLGLDTAAAVRIFLKASIANEGIPFPVQRRLPGDLMEAIEESRARKDLHGPFDTAEEAVASMLEG